MRQSFWSEQSVMIRRMMSTTTNTATIICRIAQKHHHRRRSSFIIRRACYSSTNKISSNNNETSQLLLPSTVVLLRHGQSFWNQIPTFSGWCDVPLTDLGIEQAKDAGRLMKEKNLDFDSIYSSELKRAYESAEAVMGILGNATTSIEITKTWELNERHYGALQGLSKNNPELTSMHGAEQMTAWRREMMATPPPMDEAHPHYNPPPAPLTESLYDCQQRVLRYWHGAIVPTMVPKERSILIAAHANTIRCLIAYLDDIPHEEVTNIHIPNSVPCVYKIDPNTGKAIEHDLSPSSKSKGHWILSSENTSRLVDKLGANSECFARSVFAAWDVNGDNVLCKDEIAKGLFTWKHDPNPAINALAGKLLEELRNTHDVSYDTDGITLEQFQSLTIAGIRKHNLPLFEDEELHSLDS